MPEVQYCYLCGQAGNWTYSAQQLLTSSFTNRSLCRFPASDAVCDRCHWCLTGKVWYWNDREQKWSKLFVRSLTVLYQKDKLVYPVLGDPRTEGKDTFPTISALVSRSQIREWLLNPPEPPFTLAISRSGKKYVLPWAREAYSRNVFPVQFELDEVMVDREKFLSLLKAYETLLGLGFSKKEINSGSYRGDRLLASLEQWEPLETVIASYRGSRLLDLVGYCAQDQLAND